MLLSIISPEKSIFSGEVISVSVPGKAGTFTVLENHAAIISTLTKGEVSYKNAEDKTESLPIKSGLIEVVKNKVTICVE